MAVAPPRGEPHPVASGDVFPGPTRSSRTAKTPCRGDPYRGPEDDAGAGTAGGVALLEGRATPHRLTTGPNGAAGMTSTPAPMQRTQPARRRPGRPVAPGPVTPRVLPHTPASHDRKRRADSTRGPRTARHLLVPRTAVADPFQELVPCPTHPPPSSTAPATRRHHRPPAPLTSSPHGSPAQTPAHSAPLPPISTTSHASAGPPAGTPPSRSGSASRRGAATPWPWPTAPTGRLATSPPPPARAASPRSAPSSPSHAPSDAPPPHSTPADPTSRSAATTAGPAPPPGASLGEAARRRGDGPKAHRDRALLAWLFDLGLRRGEALALDVNAIDRAAGTVAAVRKGRAGAVRLSLPGPTRRALAPWLEAHPGPLPAAPLFVRLDPGAAAPDRLTGDGTCRVVKALGRHAGIARPVRPHGLRHPAITAAPDPGRDVREVRRFSRHTKLETVVIDDDDPRDVAGEIARQIAAVEN